MKKISKILYLSFAIIILSIFFTINTFAYLDPSVVTYVIQAIAGIVIAGSAVFVVVWTRARKKIAKKLNIDENKNKEVEEDIVVNNETNDEVITEEFVDEVETIEEEEK